MFTVVWLRFGGSVAHTLMRRYVNKTEIDVEFMKI